MLSPHHGMEAPVETSYCLMHALDLCICTKPQCQTGSLLTSVDQLKVSDNNMLYSTICLCSVAACMCCIVSTLKLVQEQGAHQIVLIEEAPRRGELKLLPIPSSRTVTDQLTLVLRHCRAGDRCVPESSDVTRFVSSAWWLEHACAGMKSLSYNNMF